MVMFFQILFANLVLIFLLITVHEIGHWFFGWLAGIPIDQMKIKLFTFPQQVQIRDQEGWISVSTFDRYFHRLREMVPSVRGLGYVVGGFVFETLFLVGITIGLGMAGYWLFAIVAPGVSLLMYLIYVFAMDLPQSRSLQRPWGDTTILHSLSPAWSCVVIVLMIITRTGLVLTAAFRWTW